MDIEELIDDIQGQLDDADSSYLTAEKIVRWANDGQRRIARRTRCLRKSATVTTVIDQAEYTVTNLFGVESLYYPTGTNTGHFLTRVTSWEKAESLGFALPSPSSVPYHYIVSGSRKIYLLPPPGAVVNMTLRGVFLPVTMVYISDAHASNVDPEIPEEYQDAIVMWVKYKFYSMQEDQGDAQVEKDNFEKEIKDIRSDEFLKDTDGPEEIAVSYY
jgi:hypothetical protein